MKKILFVVCALFFISTPTAEAQIWKRVKNKVNKRIDREVDKRVDDVLNGKKKKKKRDKDEQEQTSEETNTETTTQTQTPTTKSPELWRKFKFIPGEKVIFYDDLKYEEVGEFPARWDLVKGGAEVARLGDDKVIIATTRHWNKIIPLFNTENYLTDEFTIEFDVFVPDFKQANVSWIELKMIFDKNLLKQTNGRNIDINLSSHNNKIEGYLGKFALEEVPLGALNQWHHISMSYYKGKVKLYYDERRVANIPRMVTIPNVFGLDISAVALDNQKEHPKVHIKNIKIAHGGGQMYKRIIADGKYVTNGILFDSGKATIKPQSMGIINKMVTVMQENSDFKFQIIGHTDSDGATESNQTLSEQRANAVKQAIVNAGIKAERLTTLGKGESAPLNGNSTPEEKANNRRVEFILQK